MFCHRCGHRNPAGVNFCSLCGDALASDPSHSTILLDGIAHPQRVDDALEVSPHALAPSLDQLVVSEGPNAGTSFEVGSRVLLIGRSSDADLFFDDVTVSRRHAELARNERGRLVLRDLGSLNGTYLNRVRVEQAILEPGDEVQIGKFKFVFVPRRTDS